MFLTPGYGKTLTSQDTLFREERALRTYRRRHYHYRKYKVYGKYNAVRMRACISKNKSRIGMLPKATQAISAKGVLRWNGIGRLTYNRVVHLSLAYAQRGSQFSPLRVQYNDRG